jgi:hypothetical protein
VRDPGLVVRVNVPNRLRAYILADKKSESPAIAPSGVRQDMFVDFMMCFKYSRGPLARKYEPETESNVWSSHTTLSWTH